ncbi:MAG TPA: CPBP family glutamic-type intramembrane protease [Acidobacteriota bacterium]|nr:CPBP family glutamic-type intramembrane protease [Acidobacteriota bacterium]HQP75534.1 CPBP family glutamic-type intramembrane protease [Acidobacteriota bacterium]
MTDLRPARTYWEASRSWTYSLILVVPLLIIYEAGILAVQLQHPVRNGADALIKALLQVAGVWSAVGFGVLLAAALGARVWVERKRHGGAVRREYLLFMAGESVLYALLLAPVVGRLTQAVLPGLSAPAAIAASPGGEFGLGAMIILSLGAGIYEELLFRVLLMSGLLLALKEIFPRWPKWASYTVAATAAALLFSAFHYIGEYGDPFSIVSFTFRFVAGLVLNALYAARGYGIAVWTHALYDIFLAVTVGW